MGLVQGFCQRRSNGHNSAQIDVVPGVAEQVGSYVVGPYLVSRSGREGSNFSASCVPPHPRIAVLATELPVPLPEGSVAPSPRPAVDLLVNLPLGLLALALRCLSMPERLSVLCCVSRHCQAASSHSAACRAIVLREYSVGLSAGKAEERVKLRGFHHYSSNAEGNRRFAALHLAACGGYGAVSHLEVLDLESLEQHYGNHSGWTQRPWLPMFTSCRRLRVLAIPLSEDESIAALLRANATTLRNLRLEGEHYGDIDPMDPLQPIVVEALGMMCLDKLHLVGLNWGAGQILSLGTVRSLVLTEIFAWVDEDALGVPLAGQLPGPIVLAEPLQLKSLAVSIIMVDDDDGQFEGVWDAQFLASDFVRCEALVDVTFNVSPYSCISAKTRERFLADGPRRTCSLDDSIFLFPHGAAKDTLYAEQLHWQGPGNGIVLGRCGRCVKCHEVSLAADGQMDVRNQWYCSCCWRMLEDIENGDWFPELLNS